MRGQRRAKRSEKEEAQKKYVWEKKIKLNHKYLSQKFMSFRDANKNIGKEKKKLTADTNFNFLPRKTNSS